MTASESSPGDDQETVVSQATTETVEADPLRFGGDCPPISYRVKGSGYVRVEAAGADDRVAEPHVAVFASLTEITLGGDADTDAWGLAVSLTYDTARTFVDDLYTTNNDDEYCDEAYDVGIGVTWQSMKS